METTANKSTVAPAAPLSGAALDLEIMRFVRNTEARTPAKVLAGIHAAFPTASRSDVLASIDRLARYVG
jgi:hypothetical protein